MAIDNNSLCYLFDSIFQVENVAGRPVVGGHIEVFIAGTDQKYITWQNFDGTKNPFKIPLNNDGRAVILVEPHYTYDIYIYDSFNNMICSRLNVKPAIGGDVTVYGLTEVWHDETMSGEGTPQSPLSVVSAGKVYDGIEPIVVNNIENKISANHIPLGVQEPLYFVEDSESACIIGCSAQTEIPVELSGKWDEASEAVIANSAQWAEGTEYEAGNYVSIDNNTISVTGLSPVPADTASTGLVASVSADITAMIPDTSDMATQTWVNEQGFLTAHQSLDGLMSASLLEFSGSVITAYSGCKFAGEISGDAGDAEVNALVHSNSGTWNSVTAKLDTTAFSDVSGTFLTAHQSLDGLMSADLLEISDNKITGYNGTAFAGQDAGDYELSAGSGISIVDYPLEQKTVISVTAQGGNPEVEQAVIDNSATWNNVSSKLDTTAFSDVSGTFLTAHQDLSDYQTIAGMTAYQEAGNYLSANALDELSGNWETVTAKQDSLTFGYHDTAISSIDNSALYDNSAHARINTLAGRISDLSSNKLDTTAFSDVSGTFLTAHQDISNKLDTTAFSDVSGSFLTAVPDTYIQNTDLSTEDGKITAISGLPLSAGDELPEGLMNESGLGYNAVNEISGYNGSAIAQYGAEKQFLTHDDTIVHIANSAQYAFGCNVPVVAQQMGVDETVLWSGTPDTTAYNMTLSDNLNNYNYFVVIWKSYQRVYRDGFVANTTAYPLMLGAAFVNTDGNYEKSLTTWATTDGLTYNWKATIHGSFTGSQSNQWIAAVAPLEIHGIGRKV